MKEGKMASSPKPLTKKSVKLVVDCANLYAELSETINISVMHAFLKALPNEGCRQEFKRMLAYKRVYDITTNGCPIPLEILSREEAEILFKTVEQAPGEEN